MKIRCPSCFADFALEAALEGDAARRSLVWAFSLPATLSMALTNYLAMFRAEGRSLAWSRVEKILDELHLMIEGEIVTRTGVTRAAPSHLWKQALEEMIDLRNKRKLTLPLKSNGYLLDIVKSLAEREAAMAEDEREANLKQGRRDESSNATARGDIERRLRLSSIKGDLELGLIDDDQAHAQMLALGIVSDAAHRLLEEYRRDRT